MGGGGVAFDIVNIRGENKNAFVRAGGSVSYVLMNFSLNFENEK